MPEYSIDFSENLIKAARFVLEYQVNSVDAKRTVLYLSLLSCEITMKALLERAGKPVKMIKKRLHNLDGFTMRIRPLQGRREYCEWCSEMGSSVQTSQ